MIATAHITRACAAAVVLAIFANTSPATSADLVKIAYIGGTADVGFYIADARGYLKEAGIEVEFILAGSSAKMVAPLATGDVDVGSGAVSAALYNAFDRGITMRVVADKSGNKGSLSYQHFLVRKTLWDSGEVRTLKDLKGRKFAATAQGNNESAVVEEAMRSVGLSSRDLDKVTLSMPQQVAAFANNAIDATLIAEPFLSAILKSGTAVSMMPVTKVREHSVTGIVIYSDHLIKTKPDIARRMMAAYIRGLRFYTDALKDGRLAGPGADEVTDIIAKYSVIKDKALLRSTIPHSVDPDGHVPMDSLRKDWEYYAAEKLISGKVSVENVVDTSFVETALKLLGPYRPRAN